MERLKEERAEKETIAQERDIAIAMKAQKKVVCSTIGLSHAKGS